MRTRHEERELTIRADPILRTFAVVAGLYFAHSFLILIALAIAVGLALSPVVDRLTRLGLHRTLAVVLSVLGCLGSLGIVGWGVTGQIAQMAQKLPEYRDPIIAKTSHLGPVGAILREAFSKLEDTIGSPPGPEKGATADGIKGKPVDSNAQRPELGNSLGAVRDLAKILLGTLGNLIIVLVLLILFLSHQKDLADRVHRLLKQWGTDVTRPTLAEAGSKVSRYLLSETLVNFLYGIVIALGARLLKVPQPLFWGLLAFLFRFIPYIGTWLVAALALTLSVALSPTWTEPALLLVFWFVLELTVADFVEPWVYGKRTGITAAGVMVSALFWSWLWGIAGLMIATPLTACLVELGGEIPGLRWLHTLFCAEPASDIVRIEVAAKV